MSSYPVTYAQKRRSTRINQALPLEVQGVGAHREPYQEAVSTISISCHGCSYQTKHEVIQGELVYLALRAAEQKATVSSAKARVKWIEKHSGTERGYRVAVELETAGNIWGIVEAPPDWFAPQTDTADGSIAKGRELRVVPRTPQNLASSQVSTSSPAAGPLEAGSAKATSLTQVVAGLGEQMQLLAAQAARESLLDERNQQLNEFRAALRDETSKAMQAVLASSKDEIVRSALKGLLEAHEAGARTIHAKWIKKIEQDLETARQHMIGQINEVNQRVDSMAAATIEHVHRSMESARLEALDRFVARFREQVTPIVSEANQALQTLSASAAAFKKESAAICSEVEQQLTTGANSHLAKIHEDLDKSASEILGKTDRALTALAVNLERSSQEHAESLFEAMQASAAMALEERTRELSREFANGLEVYARNYLETLGKSLADISRIAPRVPKP